jgi:hypothetical protein
MAERLKQYGCGFVQGALLQPTGAGPDDPSGRVGVRTRRRRDRIDAAEVQAAVVPRQIRVECGVPRVVAYPDPLFHSPFSDPPVNYWYAKLSRRSQGCSELNSVI